MKRYKINTEPAAEPVTLSDVKLFLRIDLSGEDALLTSLIKTARIIVEKYLSISLITQKWELHTDKIFYDTYLSMYPIQAIDSITAYLEDNTESVISSDDYRLDSAGNRIIFVDDYSFPSNLRSLDKIKVIYTAGYGDAGTDVPEAVKQGILNLISVIYECRGACEDIPFICRTLIDPYRDLTKLGARYY